MTKLPAPETETVDLLIIAGEHSGDEHAAKMLRGLKEQMPECRVCAMGGEKLAAEGAQLLLDMTVFSVVGFIEVVKKYRFFKLLLKETCIWIEKYRPKAICFVDYPGFNLRLAKYLFKEKLSRKAGGDIALSYYIGPQIWAWKKGRRFLMSRYLDRLAVIFPFEREAYKDTCLPVDFVGHPLVSPDAVLPVTYREGGPLLLLPGSREQAVARIFPIMVKVFHLLQEREIFDRGVVLYPRGKAVQAVLEKICLGHPHSSKRFLLKKQTTFPWEPYSRVRGRCLWSVHWREFRGLSFTKPIVLLMRSDGSW